MSPAPPPPPACSIKGGEYTFSNRFVLKSSRCFDMVMAMMGAVMMMMLCRAGAGLISSLSAPSPPPALRYSLRKGRLHKPFPRPPRPRTWWHKSWLSRYFPQTSSLSTPTSNIVIMMIIMVEMVVVLLHKMHPSPSVFLTLHIILFSSSHSFWKYTGCLKIEFCQIEHLEILLPHPDPQCAEFRERFSKEQFLVPT